MDIKLSSRESLQRTLEEQIVSFGCFCRISLCLRWDLCRHSYRIILSHDDATCWYVLVLACEGSCVYWPPQWHCLISTDFRDAHDLWQFEFSHRLRSARSMDFAVWFWFCHFSEFLDARLGFRFHWCSCTRWSQWLLFSWCPAISDAVQTYWNCRWLHTLKW